MTLISDEPTTRAITERWLTDSIEQALQAADRQRDESCRNAVATVFRPEFQKGAEIVASRWSWWGPALMSNDELVDIDLTEFADDPDAGEGGGHMLWIIFILVMLCGRTEYWAQTWQPGQRWIARFELKKAK